MPLYELICSCGYGDEKVLGIKDDMPQCPECGQRLQVLISAPSMIKIKGEGGYPSRRKQIFNTTKRNHPKLT